MMDENKENVNDENDNRNYNDAKVRRLVRAKYRSLANDIEENVEEITNPESDQLYNALQKTEHLFTKVRHPREAAHDSTVLLNLCRKGRQQAQQLKTDIISFDNHTFSEKLISYLRGRNLAAVASSEKESSVYLVPSAWEKLGDRTSPLFKRTPKFDFLLGPLVLEVVLPPAREKNRKKLNPEGELVKLTQVDQVEEQEEATTKEVERIRRLLAEKTNGGDKFICFFTFIINPKSFGQTIENLFHLSFLIKDGKAVVEIDKDGLPTLNLHKEYMEQDYEEAVTRKQVVMPLSIEEWKELIQAYNITESMIPTRKSS